MKRHLFISIVLVILSISAYPQLVPGGIIHAFETGDAKLLSKYFNENLELQFPGKDNVMSKDQATRNMQTFFKENKPQSFTITYEEDKKETRYGNGTLECKKAKYHVRLYFLEGTKEKIIYRLSIEKI